jgi:hypothetical protein
VIEMFLDAEDAHRVHRTTGLYFVSRGGVAHDALDCMFVDVDKVIDRPSWRVATASGDVVFEEWVCLALA